MLPRVYSKMIENTERLKTPLSQMVIQSLAILEELPKSSSFYISEYEMISKSRFHSAEERSIASKLAHNMKKGNIYPKKKRRTLKESDDEISKNSVGDADERIFSSASSFMLNYLFDYPSSILVYSHSFLNLEKIASKEENYSLALVRDDLKKYIARKPASLFSTTHDDYSIISMKEIQDCHEKLKRKFTEFVVEAFLEK